MRKKTIAAVFSVYFALCTVYGATWSMISSGDSDSIEIAQETQTTGETLTQSPAAQEEPAETESSAAETQRGSRSRKKRSNVMETSPSPEDSQTETTTETTQPETIQEEAVEDDDREQFDQTVTSPPETVITETPVPDVPSLDEYLQNLRCGGCRKNCSLASPRCMNGSRKASQAESEYYDLYG